MDQLAGGVGQLVDRVPDDAVDDCLRLLCVSVVDITGVGGAPAVRAALGQSLSGTQVPAATHRDLTALATQRELDGVIAHRAGDLVTHRAAFRAARAVTCLAYATGAGTGDRFAESVYEAAMAMAGSAGVVAILADFIP